MLKWNELSADFQYIGTASGFSTDYAAHSITVELPRNLMNYPDKISMFVTSFNPLDLLNTIDYAPSDNLGYLSAAFSDEPMIDLDPLFAVADPVNPAAIGLHFDGSGLQSGFYQAGITLYTTAWPKMRQTYVPTSLDYITSIERDSEKLPTVFQVAQNYPNPFNPTTRVKFGIPKRSNVKVEIFNLLGQKVFEQNKTLPAGYHIFLWNATGKSGLAMPSGVYFYRISNGSRSIMKKMILLR